ncbi:head-tail connector protein [Ornithinibacillus sp. 4-3]|uniref:Head-tail connector protein n=1 Tax=Ornithinibacillus sp. 4-3 TaxID=3231488 RepID=A0AB39HM89_9BACI
MNKANLLTHVKEYLRIDGDHDNDLLGLLIKSAIEYLSNAGVNEQENELYKLAITMLVTHWYEQRHQSIDGRTSRVIEMGLQTIILQLRVGG